MRSSRTLLARKPNALIYIIVLHLIAIFALEVKRSSRKPSLAAAVRKLLQTKPGELI